MAVSNTARKREVAKAEETFFPSRFRAFALLCILCGFPESSDDEEW
jgi:hypothetical protein